MLFHGKITEAKLKQALDIHVVTRTMLLENVWDYHFDPGTNLVDVYVQRLRRKLEDKEEEALIEASRRNDRPAIRTLSTTTATARVRIELLFGEMVALGERLREAEKAYAGELGEDSAPVG